MIDKLKKDIINNKLAICLVIVYLVFMQTIFSTCCPIRAIFNRDCPGCGLTHATIYCLKGEFRDAFNANYTFFLWWGFIILFFIDRYIHKLKIKVFPSVLIFVAVVTLVRFIINIIIK